MRLPKNFWVYVKASVLVCCVGGMFVSGPEEIDSGGNPMPFWVAAIPVVFFGLFLPAFLCAFKRTEQYLYKSPWPVFPLSLFDDPLPFWHVCAWVSLATAVPLTCQTLWSYNRDQLVLTLFVWSCGVGALLGVAGAKRGLKRKQDN